MTTFRERVIQTVESFGHMRIKEIPDGTGLTDCVLADYNGRALAVLFCLDNADMANGDERIRSFRYTEFPAINYFESNRGRWFIIVTRHLPSPAAKSAAWGDLQQATKIEKERCVRMGAFQKEIDEIYRNEGKSSPQGMAGVYVKTIVELGQAALQGDDFNWMLFDYVDNPFAELIIIPDFVEVVAVCNNELIAFLRKHPELARQIPPRTFEELIAEILKTYGYEIELTAPTRDFGVDIVGIKKTGLVVPQTIVVEAKRWKQQNKVGIGLVQRLEGTRIGMQADRGLLVTTSDFSRDAYKAVETIYRKIALKNYEAVNDWLRSYPDTLFSLRR